MRKGQINTVRALLTALRTPSEPMVEAMAVVAMSAEVSTYWGEQMFTAAIDSLLEQGDGE